MNKDYPILEFDGVSQPVVSAKKYLPDFVTVKSDRCLITYFSDVVDQFERDFRVNQIFKIRTEGVRPRVFVMNAGSFSKPVYVVPMPIGAPQAARVVEAMCALGVKKFMVCGGAGALWGDDTNDIREKVLVPVSAIRDEGTSYHYLPPSREVELNPTVLSSIEKTLTKSKVTFARVKTWTTDAIFRETADRVFKRREEGAKVVEMECAAFYAVAKHKNVQLGQLLYAADTVKTDEWDYNDWHGQFERREKLFECSLNCLLDL